MAEIQLSDPYKLDFYKKRCRYDFGIARVVPVNLQHKSYSGHVSHCVSLTLAVCVCGIVCVSVSVSVSISLGNCECLSLVVCICLLPVSAECAMKCFFAGSTKDSPAKPMLKGMTRIHTSYRHTLIYPKTWFD